MSIMAIFRQQRATPRTTMNLGNVIQPFRARISSVELSPGLVPFRLEGFANAHAEGVTIGSLSDVGSQIDVILLAQLEP
jgi:hypothetical protein